MESVGQIVVAALAAASIACASTPPGFGVTSSTDVAPLVGVWRGVPEPANRQNRNHSLYAESG